MIKSQVRSQAKDLGNMFRRADVDGSGELDEEELKSMLYRANIVFEERHFDALMHKIDADGSASVSYTEFMKYFAKGGKDDKELSRKVTGVSVPVAKEMIKTKIEGKLAGGPAGLRRAFQIFDSDGSGSISKQEFIDTLKQHCMLEFDKSTIDECLKDLKGDEMNFAEFTSLVMGSTQGDRSSVIGSTGAGEATDGNGNSEQMIRRKIREHWKSLHVAFKHGDRYQTGKIEVKLLKQILDNHQVSLPEALWEERITKLDPKNTNKVSYSQFIKPYSKGSDFDKQSMATIKVDKETAKRMITDKLQGRVKGGPAGLRRAFQFFDRDGGNSISKDELQKALNEYLGLVFEDDIVVQLFDDFRGGKEDIDFHSFVQNVMGSDKQGATGLDSRSLRSNSKVADTITKGVNDPVFLRRKVREHWKDLQFAFQHADKEENGIITPKQLRWELERCDIMFADSQFNDLLTFIDKDGDGEVSYEKFFEHFSMGQEDEKLSSLVGTIKESTTSVAQAKELVREKMRGRLSGGPSELRRTFQLFDGDGGGTIDCKEFEEALKVTCGLQFEKNLGVKVMNDFSKGTGQMDFQLFTEAVMESKKTDSTSFGQHQKPLGESDGDGNSLQFVVRKVTERFKDLKVAFKHTCDKEGFLSPAQLRETLFRFDIVMSDIGFADMMKKIDGNSDGKVHFTEFMALFGPGRADAKGSAISTINNMSIPKAMELIQEKIRGRLTGGPSEMRRAFQFFDRDGGGTIDMQEFAKGLEQYCGLRFSDKIIGILFQKWDDDKSGELDYIKFCKHIMGSSGANAETSFVNDSNARHAATDAQGNSEQFLRRKIRQGMKELMIDFKQRSDKDGNLTPQQLKDILYKHDIIFADKDFVAMVVSMDEDGDGNLSYNEFLNYFKPGQADEKVTAAAVDNVTAATAIIMIKEKVEGRLPGGPAGLRRGWRVFDDAKAGEVGLKQFSEIVLKVVGINFSQGIIDGVMAILDDNSSGSIDYRKFCENLMGSNRKSMTSMADNAAQGVVSDDTGNSDQFLRRKVRMAWKQLINTFKHEADKDGNMSPEELRDILFRFDIIMANTQFTDLVAEMDEDGDGQLSCEEFLKYFAVGTDHDKNVIGTITNMSLVVAKNTIREKMRGRLAGGPAEIRRSFQFFDRDGSGAIDMEEFAQGLVTYCGLKFEDSFLKQLMSEFDDGSGEISYQSFAELVMESSANDTGLQNPSGKVTKGRARPVATIFAEISEKATAKGVNLLSMLRAFDNPGIGKISCDEFTKALVQIGVKLMLVEQRMIFKDLDPKNDGLVDYVEFAAANQGDQPEPEPLIAMGMDTPKPKALAAPQSAKSIKEFIVTRIEQRSADIKDIFRKFDDDKSGHLNYNEFRKGLLFMNCPLNDKEFDMLCTEVDNDGNGTVDYAEFVEDMQESSIPTTQFGEASDGNDRRIPEQKSRLVEIKSSEPPARAMEAKGIGISDPFAIKDYIVNKVEGKSPSIHTIFRNFDLDHSGYLSEEEFRRGLLFIGIPLNDTEFGILIAETDRDGSGDIDYHEFVAECRDGDVQTEDMFPEHEPEIMDITTGVGLSGAQEIVDFVKSQLAKTGQSLGSLFARYEEDGGISYDEVRAGLLRFGIPLNDTEFQLLISAWDPYDNGVVSYEEFADDVAGLSGMAEMQVGGRRNSQTSRGSVGSRGSDWGAQSSPVRNDMMEAVSEDSLGTVSGTALLSNLDRRVSDAKRRSSVQASGTDAALAAMISGKGGNRRKPSLADYGNSSLRA